MAKKIDKAWQESFPKVVRGEERHQVKEFHFEDGSSVFGACKKYGSVINATHFSPDQTEEHSHVFYDLPNLDLSLVETVTADDKIVAQKEFDARGREVKHMFTDSKGQMFRKFTSYHGDSLKVRKTSTI